MSPEQLWSSLVGSAVAGTDRRPLQPQMVAALQELGVDLPANQGAQTLLEALAALHLLRRAAAGDTSLDHSLPAPAEMDAQDGLPPANALRRDWLFVVHGPFTDVLPELLGLLKTHKRRLPADLLPDLLRLSLVRKDYRWIISDLLGSRGRWVAARQPQVFLVSGSADTADWQTMPAAERPGWMEYMLPRQPDRVRELLTKTWQDEKADDKLRFLEMLAAHLQPQDALLLEKAAADRSRPVRTAAIALLFRLHARPWFDQAVELYLHHFANSPGIPLRPAGVRAPLPEEKIKPWLPFLPTDSQTDQDFELWLLLLRILPVENILTDKNISFKKFLSKLYERDTTEKALSALLESLALHNAADRLPQALEICCKSAAHPVWKTAGMKRLLHTFPVQAALYAAQHDKLRGELLLHFAAALAKSPTPWPRDLLWHYLGIVEERWGGVFYENNTALVWMQAVRMAAYTCSITDADNLEPRFYKNTTPRPGPLQVFYDIVRFRRRIRAAIE